MSEINCPDCISKDRKNYCPEHNREGTKSALGNTIFWVLLAFITISSLFFRFGYKIYKSTSEECIKNLASVGDSFGGINALFSSLAFAGVIYTILLQRKELSLQRAELSLTRDELKKSADSQKKLTLLEAYNTIITRDNERILVAESAMKKIRDLIENELKNLDGGPTTPHELSEGTFRSCNSHPIYLAHEESLTSHKRSKESLHKKIQDIVEGLEGSDD